MSGLSLENRKGLLFRRKVERRISKRHASAPDRQDSDSDFQYDRLSDELNSIRLLKRTGEDEWMISTFSIAEAPEYQALSYTWASRQGHEPIQLNGGAFSTPTGVLKYLRSLPSPSGWWWIDQLSINQRLHSERASQVSVMTQIYKTASKVVIWLDGLDEQAPDVFDSDFDTTRYATMHYARQEKVKDVMKWFYRHRYWSRVWIIQEIAFSKQVEVAYRNGRIPLQQMKELLLFMPKLFYSVTGQFWWLADHASSLAEDDGNKLYRLDDIVDQFCESGCTNLVDKLYAIQGLLQPEHRIAVDYLKQSKSVFLDGMAVLVREWSDEKPISDLMRICLKLAEHMLPLDMKLHDVFHRMQGFPAIVSSDDALEMKKERLVAAFTDLIGGFPLRWQYRRWEETHA